MFDSLKPYQKILLILSEEKTKGNKKLGSREISQILYERYDWPFSPKQIARTINPLKSNKILIHREKEGNFYEIMRDGLSEIEILLDKPKKISLPLSKLSKEIIQTLGPKFNREIYELSTTMSSKCPISSAIILRRIFEKALILIFLRHGYENQIKDSNGQFENFSALLNRAQNTRINGKLMLNPKNVKKIEGMKFLGDTAAHNPLTTPEIEDIETQLPYYTMALAELIIHL